MQMWQGCAQFRGLICLRKSANTQVLQGRRTACETDLTSSPRIDPGISVRTECFACISSAGRLALQNAPRLHAIHPKLVDVVPGSDHAGMDKVLFVLRIPQNVQPACKWESA